ncbi:hypothetical protein OAK03_05140 [Gammaproteobacteria bacterium]|nr:hypothetical protein [Gammaproteobacteria bacterium]
MKIKLFLTSLILFSFSTVYSIEADVWEYKVKPGHMNEAVELFEEAIKLSRVAGRNTTILQQNFGKDGEFKFHWVDFHDSLEARAKDKAYDSADFSDFITRFYASGTVSTVRSYTMTLIDDQLCNNAGVVEVYVWKPNSGMFSNVIEEFKASSDFFEKHGWEVDLWQENIGGRDNLQFVMCSKTPEDQAKSFASLNNDKDWLLEQPNAPLWDSSSGNSKFIGSFQLEPIIVD